jgi:hypothetical protein
MAAAVLGPSLVQVIVGSKLVASQIERRCAIYRPLVVSRLVALRPGSERRWPRRFNKRCGVELARGKKDLI